MNVCACESGRENDAWNNNKNLPPTHHHIKSFPLHSFIHRSFPLTRDMWKPVLALFLYSSLVLVTAKPLNNLQVTLRGHKYEISDVETVQDLQRALEKSSGVDPKQQGRVLFGGKKLSGSLEEAGVTDGAQLNLVKTKSSSKPSVSTPSVGAPTTGSSAASSTTTATPDMNNQLNEFMKSMGGDGNKTPDMKESMEAMGNMMNSPIFQEFMSDPDKLEESRQMILSNPLLKNVMAGMPGMEELLNDPVAWREAMQAAANLYKNMDPQDLMNAMMGDGGGMPSGMFDGLDSTPMAALDELSEGED